MESQKYREKKERKKAEAVARGRHEVEKPPVHAESDEEATGEAHARRRGPKHHRSNS